MNDPLLTTVLIGVLGLLGIAFCGLLFSRHLIKLVVALQILVKAAVLGFVLADQASFAKSYVKDQLSEQKITFATEDRLTEEETSWKPGSVCLIENAGKLMQKGIPAREACQVAVVWALSDDREIQRSIEEVVSSIFP